MPQQVQILVVLTASSDTGSVDRMFRPLNMGLNIVEVVVYEAVWTYVSRRGNLSSGLRLGKG